MLYHCLFFCKFLHYEIAHNRKKSLIMILFVTGFFLQIQKL